ncbi:MAG: non-homologous end joining protein Ku [Thermoanaerobaculia bacterium]
MAARAIWKGVLHVGTLKVPVKLYSAVQDRAVHFRLLHKTDKEPVKQQLISSDTGEPVEYSEVRKAFPITRGRLVMLEKEELETLEPEDSRDIEITRFVNIGAIDHRWYERAYYLGPDGSAKAYFAAAAALERKKKEGVARWVMRDRSYVGSLRVEQGYLMLITLRHAEEIIAADALKPPGGRALQQREIPMAGQLLEALHDEFDPAQFRDEYRARVMDLIETKAAGKKPKVVKFRPKKETDDVTDALAASLAGMKKKAGGRG